MSRDYFLTYDDSDSVEAFFAGSYHFTEQDNLDLTAALNQTFYNVSQGREECKTMLGDKLKASGMDFEDYSGVNDLTSSDYEDVGAAIEDATGTDIYYAYTAYLKTEANAKVCERANYHSECKAEEAA